MYIVTLQINTDGVDVGPPGDWDWDTLVNAEGEKPTPVQVISCVQYPIEKGKQH